VHLRIIKNTYACADARVDRRAAIRCKEKNNSKVINARGAVRRIPWENIRDRPNLMQREITATCYTVRIKTLNNYKQAPYLQ